MGLNVSSDRIADGYHGPLREDHGFLDARQNATVCAASSVIRRMTVHMPGNTTYSAATMLPDGFSGRLDLEVGPHGMGIQSAIAGWPLGNLGKTKSDKASSRAAVSGFRWATAELVVETFLFARLRFRAARWAVLSENVG
jgi:hypothetical protein